MGKNLKKLGQKFPATLVSLVVVLLTILLSVGDPDSLVQVGFYLTTTLISLLCDYWKDMGGGQQDSGNDSLENDEGSPEDSYEDQ